MLICHKWKCSCSQHRFLDCLKKEQNKEAKSFLQQVENFCELTDKSGLTLLHYAVQYDNAEMVQHLINEGCDVNNQDNTGITPLMLSVTTKNVKIVEILLKNNADIYVADSDGTNSLQLAFYLRVHLKPPCPWYKNSHLILEMLFDKVNNDYTTGALTGLSLFHFNDLLKFAVVVFGSAEMTMFLLENRYPIDFREPEQGCTALHCAIRLARFKNADMIMDFGADIDVLDNDGCSPLSEYTSYFNTTKFEDVDEKSEVLKCFLRYSKRLSACHARGGFTELERLLAYGKKKTVKTVFQSDVDVMSCIRKNKSLLSMLINNRDVSVIDLLDELNIEFDANERIVNFTPLIEAVIVKCPKKVEFFLQHGADVNMTDYTQFRSSPLSHAMILSISNTEEEKNVAKIIELLLEYGANGVQTFFIERQDFPFDLPTKVIVAHLALLGIIEHSSLTKSSRSIIESKARLKTYFDLCTKQLNEMKNMKVNSTMTLFKLLREKENAVVAYARNEDFLSSWNYTMEELSHFEDYYLNALQKRLSRVLDEAKLRDKAALVVGALIRLRNNVYHVILSKIVSYLDHQDVLNLCEIVLSNR